MTRRAEGSAERERAAAVRRALAATHLPPEHHHRDVTGGPLRPAVFGAMDGLVSNLALISGFAGSNARPGTIALAGVAGLIAGAFSMAAGEYLSVTSQSELAHAEIALEKSELRRNPEAEEAELAAVYIGRGVDPDLAQQVASQLSRDREQAWRIHAREELGIDPDDLPSPSTAAASSFVFFTIGALLPLIPYLFGASSIVISVVVSALGLFGAGVVTSRFTNRSWLYTGLRQLVFGVVAAGVTYLVGDLVGTAL